MAKKVWFTHDDYMPKNPKKLDDLDIVERDSYVDPKKQIQQMMMAGQRLSEFRKEEFDTMDGDAEENPVFNSGFDVIDANVLLTELNVKKKEYESLLKESKEKGIKVDEEDEKKIEAEV